MVWQVLMLNKFKINKLKTLYLILLVFGFKVANAHNPDLSSLMIYKQNGKSILVIKSSLTAFEGEVDFTFGKGQYKTPDEFNQLVIKHFKNNCFVIANGDTLSFSNIQVRLGHETTLFAEIGTMPDKIKSFKVCCTIFKDMANNTCELILTDIGGLPQKQYVLNNKNEHTVDFRIQHDTWIMVETAKPFYFTKGFLIGLASLMIIMFCFFIYYKKGS